MDCSNPANIEVIYQQDAARPGGKKTNGTFRERCRTLGKPGTGVEEHGFAGRANGDRHLCSNASMGNEEHRSLGISD
jgi:hypothetical protein